MTQMYRETLKRRKQHFHALGARDLTSIYQSRYSAFFRGTGWSTNSICSKFIPIPINISDVKQIQSVREQNFEGDVANNKRLDRLDAQ